MSGLDVVAVGKCNPDLNLDRIAGPPRVDREILAERARFKVHRGHGVG